jgi:hypothetical protein
MAAALLPPSFMISMISLKHLPMSFLATCNEGESGGGGANAKG